MQKLKMIMAIEFYITFFTFSFLNIFLALKLNATNLVLNKHIINLKLGFSTTLKNKLLQSTFYNLLLIN